VSLKQKIYNYQGRIDKILENIDESDFHESNKQYLTEFYRHLVIKGLSKARIIKYLDTLYSITYLLEKPFEEVRKEDIATIIQKIEEKDYSDWTKRDYKVIIKIFFRWLKDTEGYPDIVKWIKKKPINKKLPDELLSKEDIKKLVDAAENLRDKAFILVLYESGCRIGELLTLRLRNVQFDKFGCVLIVNGKTGSRRVRLILSSPKLGQWIENHPRKDDPEAPLWVTIGMNSRNTILKYTSIRSHLKKIARKARLKKRVYPHLFRHSRATHLANKLTEAQMKQYFGWVQSSDMASTYVHLSGRDVDNALLKINGIDISDEKQENGLTASICPRCKSNNSPDALFCSTCGLCLDEKTSFKIEETRMKADKLMNELVNKPQVLDALIDAVAQIKN